ncbi:MAG: ribonuclease J, partial [Mycoplasmoidaceae bacterium]|nr:ribonuclease J [Mycoplasmoidaceae bacterium]
LKTLPIPKIYAAKLSAGIIKKKFKEHKDLNTYEFSIIDDNSIIKSQHFTIEFFRVCHSIPDAFGILFQTPNGNIVSTGDFRFDFSTQGDESDITKMAQIGARGITALLCESTNSETPGFSTSEKYIIAEIKKIIDNAPGRVFVSTFASNLGRIEEIIEIGIKNNRKICLIGRSMIANIETSIDVGFLNVSNDCFIEPREIAEYPDKEVLVLCTGSQGEEMAALNQMALGRHA